MRWLGNAVAWHEGDNTKLTDGERPFRPVTVLTAGELMDMTDEIDTYFQLPGRLSRWLDYLAEGELDAALAPEPAELGEVEPGRMLAEMQADEWSTEVTAAQNDVAWFEAMTPDHRSTWAREMLRRGRRLRISLDRETKSWLRALILRKDA